MNKIYLHIGPPKTATTSLQYWLNDQNFDYHSYEGVIQPRESDSITLSDLLLLGSNTNASIEKIRKIIVHKSVIISEEVFAVIKDKSKWEKSMAILSDILSPFDPIIIICLREPSEAIRSYYQEVFHMLPDRLQRNINDFASSDWCLPYDYSAFTDSLRQAGFRDFKYICFDKLISGQYTFNEIFEGIDQRKILLKRENISKKEGSKLMSNNKVSLKKVFSELMPDIVIKIVKKSRLNKWLPDLKYYKRINEDKLHLSLEQRYEQNYYHLMNRLHENSI